MIVPQRGRECATRPTVKQMLKARNQGPCLTTLGIGIKSTTKPLSLNSAWRQKKDLYTYIWMQKSY